MTVKDLKELVSKIPEEYDDLPLVTNDPKYDEYCMGNSFELVDGVNNYKTSYRAFTKFGDMNVYYFRLYG